MPRLSAARKKSLVDATVQYRKSLPGSPAEEYLAKRGLTDPSVANAVGRFRLGYVADPAPGHENYKGMLAIPYLRQSATGQWTAVSLRFRCITEGCEHRYHGKYNTIAGDRPRLFNAVALTESDDEIGIAEGEPDTATIHAGVLPTVGVPGVDAWLPHFRTAFLGYRTVYVFKQMDDTGAGERWANAIASTLPDNAVIVPAMNGEDFNSMFVKHGMQSIRDRIRT